MEIVGTRRSEGVRFILVAMSMRTSLRSSCSCVRMRNSATDQLRYIAGSDAEAIIAQRKAAGDASFLSGLKSQFDL